MKRVSVVFLLLVLVEYAFAANVTQSRTFFSEIFRTRDGSKVSECGAVVVCFVFDLEKKKKKKKKKK
jgi:hypothetical protein